MNIKFELKLVNQKIENKYRVILYQTHSFHFETKLIRQQCLTTEFYLQTQMSFSLSKSSRQGTRTQMSPSPRKSLVKQHKIHNNQKLKVFIKFKPQNLLQRNNQNCVTYLNQKQIEIQTSLNRKIYTFDHVFDPMVDAQSVFNAGCGQLVEDVIEGVHSNKPNNNGLVFVYGNTGTGKTHTMGLIQQLNPKSKGIIPDALRHIFQDNNTVEQVCLSFCEIYKDQVYDLLDFQDEKKLTIRQNQKSKEPYIEDLIIIQVTSFKQASQLINIGLEKRRIAQQKVNKRSSRGHGVITIYMKNKNSQHTGRVCFVDLAGCQRIKDSQSKGTTLNQALHINASLSALQTLLMNISDQNVRSYRSNKLTRLLQPYFQFGKIRLFVTSNYESTQSIEFAKRCKGIKFLERQVRKQNDKPFKTPRKAQKNDQNKRQNKKIQQLKIEFAQRQKNYLKCISNLVSIIHKVYENTSSAIKNQSIHSSFSLPELFQHLPLQSKVNAKINIFQKKQEDILFDESDNSFSKMSSQISTNISQSYEDMNSFIEKTQQVMKNMQQIGFSAVKKIIQLSQLAEYKNVYKKEWFTSEIKNGLLQNKNGQIQKGISFLIQQLSKLMSQTPGNAQTQTKIFKKLKEYGIVFAQENSLLGSKTCNFQTKNGIQSKNSASKIKTPRKLSAMKTSQQNEGQYSARINQNQESNQNSQQFYNKSRKRSLIYIDEE